MISVTKATNVELKSGRVYPWGEEVGLSVPARIGGRAQGRFHTGMIGT